MVPTRGWCQRLTDISAMEVKSLSSAVMIVGRGYVIVPITMNVKAVKTHGSVILVSIISQSHILNAKAAEELTNMTVAIRKVARWLGRTHRESW